MRDRIFELVQLAKHGDRVSRAYDIFMVVIACASLVPVLFHLNQLPQWARDVISTLDVITVYILAFDYILRWITHDIAEGRRGNWRSFVRYPFTLGAIIDLLSILPSLNVLPEGFLFLRVLRVFRIFRYSKQLTTIANVFAEEKKTLGSVLALAIAYIFVTALVMFSLEGETFDSFVDALYWSTITVTTVGFGDIHPTTDLGMMITSISSIFGIFVLALPAGIMTSSFLHQLRLRREDEEEYYSESFIGEVKPDYFRITPAKVKEYRKNNPKVRMYLRVILFGVALNFVLCFIASEVFWQPIWLDTTGTAIVAFLLEPAAGIIVGFINNLIIAVYTGNAGNLLYVGSSAVTALAYGFLLRRSEDGKLPVKQSFQVLGIVIVCQTLISYALAMLLYQGQVTTIFQADYQEFFLNAGATYATSTMMAFLIDRIIDAIGVFVIAAFFRKLFVKPRYNPHIWLAGELAKADKASCAGSVWEEGEGRRLDEAEGKNSSPSSSAESDSAKFAACASSATAMAGQQAQSSYQAQCGQQALAGSQANTGKQTQAAAQSLAPLAAKYGNAIVADADQLNAAATKLRHKSDEYMGAKSAALYEAGAVALELMAKAEVSTPEEFDKAFAARLFPKKPPSKEDVK